MSFVKIRPLKRHLVIRYFKSYGIFWHKVHGIPLNTNGGCHGVPVIYFICKHRWRLQTGNEHHVLLKITIQSNSSIFAMDAISLPTSTTETIQNLWACPTRVRFSCALMCCVAMRQNIFFPPMFYIGCWKIGLKNYKKMGYHDLALVPL